MDANHDSMPRKAGRKEWIGLGVIALPCLLYSMDLTVLNLAVPHLSADLKPSANQLLWIVDIYGFMVAGALIIMGTLGDRVGRRKLLLIGAVAFGLASVFAAFSTSAEMLIVARALLGLAAATLAPSTLSLIRNMFLDPAERTVAIGIWIASFSAGGAIGPLVGGLLLTWFWWGSVFLIAVPVMVLLVILAPVLLPEYRDPMAGRLDLVSAAQSLIAVLAVIYGIKHWATGGFDAWAVAMLVVGILFTGLFVRRQRQLADPLIDLSLFRSPAFGGALAINVLGLFSAFGSFLLTALYLQMTLGLNPLSAGLWSAPSAAAFVAGSTLAPRLLSRFHSSTVIASGFAVAALGFAMLAMAGGPQALAVVVASNFVLSLGLAPVFTLTTDLIIGAAPPERVGGAAGLAETSSEFGGALGIAILGTIAASIYRGEMAVSMPEGLPPEVEMIARETVGGAIAEGMALGGPVGEAVLAAARAAYADGYAITMAIAAVVAIVAAMVTLLLLRSTSAERETCEGACHTASAS
ncbi:MAG: MFS transporter [Rhizobiaceae bacterium]